MLAAWIGFHVFIIIALALDLGLFHKKDQTVGFKESLRWTFIWALCAMIFNIGIFYFKGQTAALEFLTGYIVEWTLSVDNLFVFLTIFTVFKVPSKLQHRVLFWGIMGALAMRAIFIFAGIALISRFHWIIYIFGVFLIVTGIKLLKNKEDTEIDPKNHWLIRFARKHFRFTDTYDQGHFIVKKDGKNYGTPLLLVLLVVEASDVMFAADSIPAILAITRDPFIVYTSNVFAILGLRSIYFALSGLMDIFTHLKYGLSCILIFVGLKMCIVDFYKVPIFLSLSVICIFLGGSILTSALSNRRKTHKS